MYLLSCIENKYTNNMHTSVKKNLNIFPLLSYVGLLSSSTPFLNMITVGNCRLKDESLILYLLAASGYRLISIFPNLRYFVSYLKYIFVSTLFTYKNKINKKYTNKLIWYL